MAFFVGFREAFAAGAGPKPGCRGGVNGQAQGPPIVRRRFEVLFEKTGQAGPSKVRTQTGKAVRTGPSNSIFKDTRQLGRQEAALGPGIPYVGGRSRPSRASSIFCRSFPDG